VSAVWISSCLRHLRYWAPLPLVLLGVLNTAQLDAQTGSSSSVGTPLTAASDAAPSSVSGQVINATTGQPVARALVRFNDRAVLTNHEGKFDFDQNTQTSGNILVSKPGFFASPNFLSAPNIYLQNSQLSEFLRLLLYPEALLTGSVIAPDGTPLPRILVGAYRNVFDESGHRIMVAGQTQTDSHGNFRLPVPAGSYRVETRYSPQDQTMGLAILPVVFPSGSSSSSSDFIDLHSGEEQHIDLRPAVGQTHVVTLLTDSSLHGFARISARSSNGIALQVNPTPNGVPGEMKLELPAGTYTLTASRNTPEMQEQAETTVTVADHDISSVVLRFAPVPSLPIELLVDSASTSDNSQPTLQQMNLMLQNDQPNFDQVAATVRPTMLNDHSYAFLAMPGSYHVQARGNGEWYVKSVSSGSTEVLQQGLVVAPGSAAVPLRVTVSNQTATLQGTVKVNGTLGAGWVYLIPTTPSAELVISLRSNSEGVFNSAHLPPGSYQAIAFEHQFSANYRDPAALNAFANQIHSFTVNAGDKATLDLEAVPASEMIP
jgi:hypothetical protein